MSLHIPAWQQEVAGLPPATCLYCGQWADTRDHLVPTAVADRQVRHSVPAVPACHECNCLLSDRFLPDVKARRLFIAQRLAARYQKLLRIPEWAPADLAELGPKLRRHIQSDLAKKRHTLLRIAWAEGEATDVT
jgi:hypothetical protein